MGNYKIIIHGELHYFLHYNDQGHGYFLVISNSSGLYFSLQIKVRVHGFYYIFIRYG